MNNHMHVLFSGSEVDVRLFFDAYKKRLARYMNKRERVINWQNFICELKKIEDYNAIRNEIAYINRNGYVVSPQFTPFSYPWGANCAFFNSSIYDILKEPFNQIPYRKRRDIFQLRESLPDSYMVSNNLILPSSYCKIKDAEQLFRNAHQYYSIVSKNWEAYRDLAKEFGDTCFLTDNEMYAAISSLCKREYGQGRPNLLSIEQKGEVARKMKYDYGASTKQIRSILRLESGLLNSLFPKL